MKTAKMLALMIAGVASLPLMAQQVNTQAQQNASASAAGRSVNESTNASAHASQGSMNASGSGGGSLAASGGHGHASAAGSGGGYAEMRPVTGELEGKLDSKTAKAGDQVMLKTNQKMQTADGTIIPKGSRLIGHVTEVQAHEKGHAASQMGLEFDRAELKDGQSLPIRSVIQSIQPNASAMAAGSMANEDAFDTPIGGSGGAVRGGGLAGGRAGGGGGLVGGTVNTATSATGRAGSELDAAAGSGLRSTGSLGGDATGSLAHGVGSGVGGAASGAGSLGARSTGIPGVMLNGDVTGMASGMLSATNRNVHLDSGTQMVLGVAAARQ